MRTLTFNKQTQDGMVTPEMEQAARRAYLDCVRQTLAEWDRLVAREGQEGQ